MATPKQLVFSWFKKIERMASEKTTESGFVMDTERALNECFITAKDAAEYVDQFFDENLNYK